MRGGGGGELTPVSDCGGDVVLTSTGTSYSLFWTGDRGVGWGGGGGRYLCEARPKHSNLLLKFCFTSTETVGLLETGAQDGHLDFHTPPDL